MSGTQCWSLGSLVCGFFLKCSMWASTSNGCQTRYEFEPMRSLSGQIYSFSGSTILFSNFGKGIIIPDVIDVIDEEAERQVISLES